MNEELSAMGKVFVLKAKTREGEAVLRRIYEEKDSEREKVIVNKVLMDKNPYTIRYVFTNAARAMSSHPGLAHKFAPFTVGNVTDRIYTKIIEEKADIVKDIELSIIPNVEVLK